MGANDKLAAAMGPLASLVADDTEPDALLGENPCLPSRSGAAAVLDACKTIDAAAQHTRNLQAAVDDIRTFIDGRHTIGAVEIRHLLESHHV